MSGDDDSDRLAEELEAMAIWETHLKHATERWHEGVRHSAEEYRRGLAEGLGVDPADVPDEAVEHWQEAVAETGPDEFADAVAGRGDDWFLGLYERATGNEPSDRVREVAREVEAEALARAGDDPSDEEVAAAVRDVLASRRGDADDG